MAKQAKVLNNAEVRKVLDYVATSKHSLRNRALVMMMFNTGMRVSEVASLRIRDVMDTDSNIKNEIRLLAENTKTNEARTVFVNEKLRRELQQYAKLLVNIKDAKQPKVVKVRGESAELKLRASPMSVFALAPVLPNDEITQEFEVENSHWIE
jgi:integrase